jgi:alpha-amylase
LTAVTATAGAQLVYTTDGTTPTANSTKVASGTKIDIAGNMTLKVGLLIGSTVSGIVTRTYTEPAPVDKKTIDIYVNTDKVSWTAVNFWSWGGDDSHSPVNKNWPGDKATATTTIGGKQWYSKQFTINGNDDYVNLVFSTGSGTPQTVDINNVTTTKFFEISDQKDGSKHLVNDVTGSYTDIREIKAQMAEGRSSIYDLQGRRVSNMQRGIYIVNGKKVVIK